MVVALGPVGPVQTTFHLRCDLRRTGVREVDPVDVLLTWRPKLAGLPNPTIAAHLCVSRRTAANRKVAVFAVLVNVLDPLTDQDRLSCLEIAAPGLQDALIQSRPGT